MQAPSPPAAGAAAPPPPRGDAGEGPEDSQEAEATVVAASEPAAPAPADHAPFAFELVRTPS